MPVYVYFCPDNGRTLEVEHGMSQQIRNWGELCYCSGEPLGDTQFLAEVEKRLTAPYVSQPMSDRQLRESGFTKLVRRDKGVYENVTTDGSEPRVIQMQDKNNA